MMSRRISNGSLVALVALLTVCGCGHQAPPVDSVKVGGSFIVAPLTKAWIEAVAKPPNPLAVVAEVTGSTTAIQDILTGKLDVITSSRRMTDNELLNARSGGKNIEEHCFGFATYSVLVHPSNTVSSLTTQQVTDIFSRRIKDWSEVGGPKLPIVCVYRKTLPGHYDLFFEKEVQLDPAQVSAQDPGIVFADRTPDIAKAVATNPGAIGYLLSTDPAEGVKPLMLKAKPDAPPAPPTPEAALEGKYPLMRPLYIYINAAAPRPVRFFAEFAMGSEGRSITRRLGFVPVPLKRGQLDSERFNWMQAW